MKSRILAAAMLSALLVICSTVKSETEPATPDESVAESAAESPAKPEQPATVMLTVDYADGAQKRFPSIPWQKKMTVRDAVTWATEHPRGIKCKQRGKGATAMVTKIDDLSNGGANSPNWIFRVNDKLGTRSCGISAVNPGDRILWKFERYK